MRFEITFNPVKGVVKAKSTQNIGVEFKSFRGGSLNELFICNIREMKLPLGFILQCIF